MVESAGKLKKGLALTSLVLGILSLPTLGLLLIGAATAIVLGVVALVKANKQPDVYGGKGLAITGISLAVVSIVVMPFMLGIVAAIAIPSLLRARVSANEAAAIGDTRTVISAQAAYQSMSGRYGELSCLTAPTTCDTTYPATAPVFLDARFADAGPQQGYARRFALAVDGTGFTYISIPEQQNRTGVRSFCGDATGIVCALPQQFAPAFSDGKACPSDCAPLR